MSGVFTITHPLLSFKITLHELDKLHVHEEIIPELVENLARKISDDGSFFHPIVVERGHSVVLDGMHRVAASKKIGFRYIPVCLVDYDNTNIQVGSWYRLFQNPSLQEALEVCVGLGLSVQEGSFDGHLKLIERREAIAALFTSELSLALQGAARDIKDAYDLIRDIGDHLRRRGSMIRYDTENEAQKNVNDGRISIGLATPVISKSEIVEVALSGRIFAPKSTRHIIPARPMAVNIPTDWLWGDLSLGETNRRMVDLLKSKRIERLPPGQVLDRKYDEELFVFR
ncbi:ABC transporter ATP-binding protein [Candidatus Bathyarchaeota archaeon]|nr:MAG: ABC transporter ATP-binding protein [Candidatus Bathyarchaeota archaeon]